MYSHLNFFSNIIVEIQNILQSIYFLGNIYAVDVHELHFLRLETPFFKKSYVTPFRLKQLHFLRVFSYLTDNPDAAHKHRLKNPRLNFRDENITLSHVYKTASVFSSTCW